MGRTAELCSTDLEWVCSTDLDEELEWEWDVERGMRGTAGSLARLIEPLNVQLGTLVHYEMRDERCR